MTVTWDRRHTGRLELPPGVRHGTRAGAQAGCDCLTCYRMAHVPHGTHRGYTTFGCRCMSCREGEADYQRRRRGSATAEVVCWCESKVLRLPWSDVAAGQTRSCGRPGCEAS